MTKVRSILIVEDDPRDTELMKASFAELGVANELIFLRDGVEALEQLQEWERAPEVEHRLPGLILLDIKMPRMSGIEVLEQLKLDPRLSRIPVVMLSSSKESTDLKRCYDLGVNAYVVKPVKFADFVGAVKQVGAFWAVINEVPPI